MQSCLTPRLVVRDAAAALQFYRDAFGVREIERYSDPAQGGIIIQSAVEFADGTRVSVVDEHRAWGNDAPPSLGGSSILLRLMLDDPDAVGAAMVEHGAEVVIPIEDRFYGYREGRVRDPFGHLWILSKVLEALEPEEIRRRIDNGG